MKIWLSALEQHSESSENLIKCRRMKDVHLPWHSNSDITLKFKMVSYVELSQIHHWPEQHLDLSLVAQRQVVQPKWILLHKSFLVSTVFYFTRFRVPGLEKKVAWMQFICLSFFLSTVQASSSDEASLPFNDWHHYELIESGKLQVSKLQGKWTPCLYKICRLVLLRKVTLSLGNNKDTSNEYCIAVLSFHIRPMVLLIKDEDWRCKSTQLTAFLLLFGWVIT